ncbi:MAG: DUF2066 domain-containing protein [Rhodanobacteraceae bacterium]
MVRNLLPLGVLLILLAAALPPARALAPASYTGEAPAASQSEADRDAALKAALAGVVEKIAGDAGIVSRPDVARAIEQAPRYVLQYQYRRDTATDVTAPGLILVAQFDQSAVDSMLASLGIGEGRAPVPMLATPIDASLWIGGIESADDYARAVGYLDKLEFVRSANPMRVRGDGMLVHVTLTTDLSSFLAALNSDGTLGVVNGSPPLDGVDATLALVPK